ncbi:MAG TPA: MBL fold metallo-hydrolase, partial [Myxococcota bacterium]|nr:MBL fold metallo-hydrolase [Myxococcota bacterium]
MKIKVLGTRGEIEESAPYHAKKSGILLDDLILLDWGEPNYIEYQPDAIFLTHLHPDHAYFVRYKEKPLTNAKIYAPEKYENLAKIKVLHKPLTWNQYVIRPIPTIHSAKVKSQAYIIEHQNKKILYTGDMIWIEKK